MNLTILDGSKKTAVIKHNVEVSKPVIKRDLTQIAKSTCEMFNLNIDIALGDILLLKNNFNDYKIVGKVVEIKSQNDKSTISFTTGIDVHTIEEFIPDNSLKGYNISEDFETCLTVNGVSGETIVATDKNLALDVLLRQSARKFPKSEKTIIDEGNGKIKLFAQDAPEIRENILRYNDPGMRYTLTYGNDTFNWLRWRNQEDKTQFADYFLKEDGTVTQDIAQAQRPLLQLVEFVEPDVWNDIEKASSRIKDQEYNNKLEIRTPFNTPIECLKFDEYLLSKRITFVAPGNKVIKTFISGIEVKNNLMILTCGLTRTKLTEKINKED